MDKQTHLAGSLPSANIAETVTLPIPIFDMSIKPALVCPLTVLVLGSIGEWLSAPDIADAFHLNEQEVADVLSAYPQLFTPDPFEDDPFAYKVIGDDQQFEQATEQLLAND